jgi:hypothetical protein
VIGKLNARLRVRLVDGDAQETLRGVTVYTGGGTRSRRSTSPCLRRRGAW